MPSFEEAPRLSETSKVQVGTSEQWNRHAVDSMQAVYDKTQGQGGRLTQLDADIDALLADRLALPTGWAPGKLLTVDGAGALASAFAEAHTVLHPASAFRDRGGWAYEHGVSFLNGSVNDDRIQAQWAVVPPPNWTGRLRFQFAWRADREGNDRSIYARVNAGISMYLIQQFRDAATGVHLGAATRRFGLSSITQDPGPYTDDWAYDTLEATAPDWATPTVPVQVDQGLHLELRTSGNWDIDDTYPRVAPVLVTWQVET